MNNNKAVVILTAMCNNNDMGRVNMGRVKIHVF